MRPNANLLPRLLLLVCGTLLTTVNATPRLPALFSEHMAIQSGRVTPCWGWSAPGATVDIVFKDTVTAQETKTRTVAVASGRWQGLLPALTPGSRGTLQITDPTGSQTIRDVIAAEVWLASGQSNMTRVVGTPDFPPHVAETARKEAADTRDEIRFFTVIQEGADQPDDDVRGKWIVVAPESVMKCSAIAWNFALDLHLKLKSPVGVLLSGHGGTPVESWLPREALDAATSAGEVWKRHNDLLALYPEAMRTYQKALADWERQGKPAASQPREPYSATSSLAPTRLYNRMIHGLIPYAVQGVIWYQGENNSGRPAEYPSLVRALVTSWRKLWGVELPFYYVELANMHSPQVHPSEGGWALIREAQASVLALPKTGVATAVDVSDGTIHPWNKKPVGQRLAALALHDVYGQSGDPRCPEYASHTTGDGKITLSFNHAAGLRMRGDGEITGFAIRGADGVWHWAQARIAGDRLEVWSQEVPSPAAVRYGWASNPKLSLENRQGLPLRPFRTDPEFP